ncbi:sulfurtransferase [Taylorella asinigenitalis]|uniref:Thiosulfate sulfurtransferase, rhodanese n=1 Tax=Taylorella asinigenitalis (strain MCE3) TaxID=1008459 RepID=G4Q9W0_TAYAM|nr:sulfurtransferase [Taylorella asinigenitalis]AEP36879.1 Thiosulfate sulfurtransferase, rhodanese [Taylorella asinigenitalis MCE3]
MTYLISPEKLKDKLDSVKILDVRHDLNDHSWGRKVYDKSHIPGAIFFDHEIDLCGPKTKHSGRHPLPDRNQFAKFLARNGIAFDDEVIAYDNGVLMFATHMWWMLRWLGMSNVKILSGGYDAWVELGYPTSQNIESYKPVEEWSPRDSLVRLVTMQEVQNNLTDKKFDLLDARVKGRYKGEYEPMDPVAGHIPGALNHSVELNLEDLGVLKEKGELADLFKKINPDPSKIVHQCGSGITACLNLFAMEEAGLTGSGLYAGSWSEWISYPENPVVTKSD